MYTKPQIPSDSLKLSLIDEDKREKHQAGKNPSQN